MDLDELMKTLARAKRMSGTPARLRVPLSKAREFAAGLASSLAEIESVLKELEEAEDDDPARTQEARRDGPTPADAEDIVLMILDEHDGETTLETIIRDVELFGLDREQALVVVRRLRDAGRVWGERDEVSLTLPPKPAPPMPAGKSVAPARLAFVPPVVLVGAQRKQAERMAVAAGVSMIGHYAQEYQGAVRVPRQARAVVVLFPHVNRDLSDVAKAAAAKAGIPFFMCQMGAASLRTVLQEGKVLPR